MKILFDQGTPAPLRRALMEHAVSTAYEMGWGQLDNGQLLAAAELEFDVLVTTDKNLRYQLDWTPPGDLGAADNKLVATSSTPNPDCRPNRCVASRRDG
ncbi:MAG TPA: hypothetical protein VEJ37_06945 [Xanthobacteraceae bacterium]|nr:hypothetical protein [Xanthobacteraceae bacterium]